VDRQRIDKWLWHARVVRTRSAAAGLASAGHVRVNGMRIKEAAALVRLGDVVTVALDRRVRMLKVQAFSVRRGPFQDAQALYLEIGPTASQPQSGASLAGRTPMR
jgi:ribosome-associated heat shock protein Hsp15